MNTISGRVVLKETGAGIPDVLVVIYDIDPGTDPEEVIPSTPTRSLASEAAGGEDGSASVLTAANGLPSTPATVRSLPPQAAGGGDRLGSVLTAADGSFELSYEDAEFQFRKPNERRPDLFLQVLAPEEPDPATASSVLFFSRRNRQNAGKTEQYLIRIPTERLTAAGIELPSLLPPEVEPAQGRVRRLQDDRVRSGAILDGTLAVARERVDTHRARFAGFSERLQDALSTALSSVPANVLQPERLVRPDESPFAKNIAVIQQNIHDIVNSDDPSKRAPARGFISLTDDEVEDLRARAGADGTIPESAVREVAAKNGAQGPTTFLQRTDLLPLCRPPTPGTDRCLSALDDSQPGEPIDTRDADDPNTGDQPITSEDIPRFLGRLIAPMTAPEEQLLVGLTPTATLDRIQRSVQRLRFQPSPADVPAFHDFHQLQIAFQHVWQELIDRGVLDLAHDAYETIVELGGDPNRAEYETANPFQAIATEAQFALRAHRLAPPPSERERNHRGDDTDYHVARGSFLDILVHMAKRPRRPPRVEVEIRDRPGAADPVVRLPALLSALEARRREKYAFTIFAANAKERSINFGILNTFRQVWTPLNYQAGPLVKSIPLAPKQTQKIVVRRKVTKKRFQKELENNLRVIKEETSQTSRAEQEIAKRASTKTDFSLTNTANGGVEGIGSGSTTTTFKHDATKSTDDVKKSFHESVFKSAQEFKNERTTEITTETFEELETTETTEISNPNDEIAVTYLFYELQRRYRLHERLFRVTPVVMVAQEVPEPQEIDPDWLVAHDWILKRVILDDSFLPTLETLPQSAGAETAIEQLAANVEQQREIVEQLRDELAIARRAADLQSNLVLDAVGKRTGGGGLLGGLVSAVTGAVDGVVDTVDGVVDTVGNMIFGGSSEANQGNRQTMSDAAEAAADRARDLTFRLEREVTALNSITETYAKALQAHHTHLTEIARLCVHVKENILHYMQGIWRHEPRDQLFFRLHNVPIPTLQPEQRRFRIDLDNPTPATITQPHQALTRFGDRKAQTFAVETLCQIQLRLREPGPEPEPEQLEFKPLCEVADLDNLLGFKGNYMLFPLFESNPLTDYMMEPYVDRATGELVDPSDPASWSLDEFSQYLCCLKEQLTDAEFDEIKQDLKELYEAILTAPRRNDDVLVVPTDSLFIEALPAAHSLIEEFKAAHRMIDVKKVQAEVREKELENIRRTARLLAEEREDPNIDQRVLIEGSVPGVVVPPPNPEGRVTNS